MAAVRSLDSSKSRTMSNEGVGPAQQELRSKVLAVGGIAGTYEELTGHKQELKVSMSVWALLGLLFANIAPSTAINSSLGAALLSGGPVASLWGWLAVALISICIALSLAELCSAWPHAAGQALWSFQLAPPRWAPFLSYWTAWWNIAGGWALIAAGAYILSAGCLGLAAAFHPDYVEQPWHLVVCFLFSLFSFFVTNLYMVRIFDRCTTSFAIINISTVVATIIALAACAPVKAKPSFVFGGFYNGTGWSNGDLVFLIGLLQSSFTIIGYDVPTHLCEEAVDAGRLAPTAVVGGTVIVGVVGFCDIIALLFSILDIDTVVSSPLPIVQILQDSFGLRGSTAAFVFNLPVLAFACIGIVCASSCAVLSMSRDRSFPGSLFFGKINPTLRVPVNALLLQVTVPAILGMRVRNLSYYRLLPR
ncbi:hypothetical protein NBRC10512_004680 [Rhodotorula toruloides]|uniref:Choline transport protein n=1 Tax=Rhodotorula toruloides (strain NP11) TaxID=1130832 RepID=M7WR25_RHOT1|nr:Choline transport protein [Rhodotorula toruloides NP11]EMS23007.1 Choline transport protein [Rhodotorula toruloides NP11]